jgi:protein-S-isoprenylcysteine O-methyltransferase Ste14
MTTARIIAIGWTVFWAYWLISALGAKQIARRGGVRAQWTGRAAAAIVVGMLVLGAGYRLPGAGPVHPDSAALVSGLSLFCGGLALCIWARLHLGRNWGMPMSDVAGAKLVTTGPYRFIRHPIYTGLLVAVSGTMLVNAQDFKWLPFLLVSLVFVIISARSEEKLMLAKFDGAYEDYRRRTKMLVPFVL